ncbi:MAG: hypothetical protein EAY72_04760 [Bacteroidetes bacterium]|nr:MAG: hypothetical protein EAY72_04760 [Bacteroidota bacterium]
MKKQFFLWMLFSIAAVSSVQSQRLFYLFGNAQYGNPTGNASGIYKNSIGANAGAGVGLLGKTFFQATVGYNRLNGEGNVPNANVTKIMGGIRQFIFLRKIFIQGNVGNASINSNGNSASRLALDAGVGAKLLGIEGSLNYEHFGQKDNSPSFGFITLRAGFNLGL